MPIIRFTGYVTPNTVIKQLASGPLSWPEDSFKATMTYSVTDSAVVAECEISDLAEATVTQMHIHAYHAIRGAVDVVSFSLGFGLSLVLESCTYPDGTVAQIRHHDKGLEALCTVSRQDIMDIAGKERKILKCLNDLTYSLTNPFEAPITCFRAVEGFRHLISPGIDKKAQWVRMRESLNISQEYIALMTKASEPPRHGELLPQNTREISIIRQRSWTIANRFLEYRKRGNVNLTAPDFPLL